MAEKRYSKNGEWVQKVGDQYRIGLTAENVADLGEVTFVELPAIGRTVFSGEMVCTIEAVKAATDFYSPLEGEIQAVNSLLLKNPQLLNDSPEVEGWIFSLKSVSESAWSGLLTEAEWAQWQRGH